MCRAAKTASATRPEVKQNDQKVQIIHRSAAIGIGGKITACLAKRQNNLQQIIIIHAAISIDVPIGSQYPELNLRVSASKTIA